MAKRSTRKGDTPGKRLLRRVAIASGRVAALAFLVEGGEWGTFDLMKQRTRFERLEAEVKRLEHDVDSLRAEYKAVTTDKVRLERIARERFGLVHGDKELLYRPRTESDADSVAAKDTSRTEQRG